MGSYPGNWPDSGRQMQVREDHDRNGPRDDNRATWFDHTLILGQPNSGKSYRQREIISRRTRAIAIDSEWQFGTGKRQNPLPGFTIVHEPRQLKEFLRPRLGAAFQVVYQPKFEPEKHLEIILQLATEVGECTIAIDEVANYCGSNWLSPQMSYVARCGRHPGLSFVNTSQRPAQVAKELTSLSQRILFFRLQEPADLQYAAARGLSDSQLETLARLPQGFYFEKTKLGEWEIHDPKGELWKTCL